MLIDLRYVGIMLGVLNADWGIRSWGISIGPWLFIGVVTVVKDS